MDDQTPKRILTRDLMSTFLFPFILGKMSLVYFGLMYTAYPGEGYGYGLAGTIVFSLSMVVRFLWRYRHYKG
jgi:hypothetical protein